MRSYFRNYGYQQFHGPWIMQRKLTHSGCFQRVIYAKIDPDCGAIMLKLVSTLCLFSSISSFVIPPSCRAPISRNFMATRRANALGSGDSVSWALIFDCDGVILEVLFNIFGQQTTSRSISHICIVSAKL